MKSIRPKSAKPAINLDKCIHQTSRDEAFSQDLLIARYLEEFTVPTRKKKTKVTNHSKNALAKSPYAKVLFADDISDVLSHTKKHKYLQPHPPKKKRPKSAPVYQMGSGNWADFDDLHSLFSASTKSSSRVSSSAPVYKRKHRVLCIRAFLNGTRESVSRVTAQDLPQLLAECTSKLNLPSAARKLYLADGCLVQDVKQLDKDCEVYVSMGEPFKNPFLSLQEREKIRKTSFWTTNGIIVPQNDKKNKKISSSLSYRMTELLDSQRKRIMVFKNGESFGGVEVVAHRFDEFLDDCTAKLSLFSGARSLHDWHGKTVSSFSQVPCLDKVLQPSNGSVMGPLWVTTGEVFSPKGAHDFLSTMVLNTNERIGNCKVNIEELENYLYAGDSNDQHNEIELSLELEENLETLENLETSLPKLKDSLKKLDRLYKKEEAMSTSTYKFRNIAEIDSNSRLLPMKGVRVLLYRNGMGLNEEPVKMFLNMEFLTKGAKTKTDSLQRLFELLNNNNNASLLTTFGVSGRKIYFKRAFKVDGTEIDDISILEPNEKIWLSQGEGFIPIYYDILSLNLEKVSVLNLWGQKNIVQRDRWMEGDMSQTKPKLWEIKAGIPPECQIRDMKMDMTDEQKLLYYKQCSESQLPMDITYLQSKDNHSLVLCPEIIVLRKGDESDTDVWGRNMQKWCCSQDGRIFNRRFKNLLLGVLDVEVQMILNDSDGNEELLDGAVVSVLPREDTTEQNSLWVFTTDGFIQSAANPGYVLTAVKDFIINPTSGTVESDLLQGPRDSFEKRSSQTWEIMNDTADSQNIVITNYHDTSENDSRSNDEDQFDEEVASQENDEKPNLEQEKLQVHEDSVNQILDEEKPYRNPFESVNDVYGGQHVALVILPRFPEKHSLIGTQRWAIKTCKALPSQVCETWQRQNLHWPVDQMETHLGTCDGFLTFGVPKLRWKTLKTADSPVYKPALIETPAKLLVLKNGEVELKRAVTVVGPDIRMLKKKDISTSSGKKLTVTDLEFSQFLDKCTAALNLPFAARRVFTQEGGEVFALSSLQKMEIVYVSCGEQWANPSTTQTENQKRLLLANLTADLAKMNDYLALKAQTGFVVSVKDNVLRHGQPLVLIYASLQENRDDPLNETENVINEQVNGIFQAESSSNEQKSDRHLTAHERSHAREKEKEHDNGLLEETINFSHEESDVNTNVGVRDDEFPMKSPSKWQYADGFIYLQSDPSLVMGILSGERNKLDEVVLCRKNVEDSNQRWILSTDGSIGLKSAPHCVLSVGTPSSDHRTEFGYKDATLTLSPKKLCVNGNSNQLFYMQQDTGYLHPFATELVNIEVTAAMKAGVCTFAVFGKTKIHQPGYSLERIEENKDPSILYLCDACGKNMRGKIKLEKISYSEEFVCAMEKAKKNKIKESGAFSHLNNKVDLSTNECEATVASWERQLKRLRDESSVRVVANELSMLQNNPAVRLMVHKNGDIKNDECIVIGNVMSQIMDMCTMKLGLPKAARRLYTIDGELITDMQQLLKPYYPELTYMKQQLQPTNVEDGVCSDEDEDFVIEKLDVRVPIDVWVSMGEPFVPLDEIEKAQILMKYKQHEKQNTSTLLEIEKHRLRQEKGRRLTGVRSTSKVKPVLMKTLQHQHNGEEKIEESILLLQNELAEVKCQQETRAKSLKMKRPPSAKLNDKMKNMKLYQIPKAIRLFAFANADDPERSVVLYAGNIEEVLDNATLKLGLTSCARRIYTTNGDEVLFMEDLKRDQVICVTTGERFIPRKARESLIELKASWARSNRKSSVDLNNNSLVEYKVNTRPPSSPIRSIKASVNYHTLDDSNTSP